MLNKRELVLSTHQIDQILLRLVYEVRERCIEDSSFVFVGVANKGYLLAEKLQKLYLQEFNHSVELLKVKPSGTDGFTLEQAKDIQQNQVIILIDDVLNTGKTLMKAAQKLMDYQPCKLLTLVLLDREHRAFPIQASMFGQRLATTLENHIEVVFDNSSIEAYLR